MRLTKEELLRFANIFDNAGQVFLGGLVLTPFFSKVDNIATAMIVLLGTLLSIACWFSSWKFTKEATKL